MNYGKPLFLIFRMLFLLLFVKEGFAQTYGLHFSGPEVSKDQRTGLDLSQFKTFRLEDGFSLSFELMLRSLDDRHHGFIARIVTDSHENIDLIYDNLQGDNKIVFVSGNRLSPVAFPASGIKNQWTKIQLTYNRESDWCEVSMADSVFRMTNLKFNSGKSVRIFFGAVPGGLFETSDVPAMNLKDVQISKNEKPVYEWPLNEQDGNFATDKGKKLKAKVFNPTWLSRKHNNWELVKSMKVSGDAAVTFNQVSSDLIVVNEDKLTKINVDNQAVAEIRFSKNGPQLKTGAGNIFDDSSGTVFCYDIKTRHISSFNYDTKEWESALPSNTANESYSHHNKLYSPKHQKLFLFGGFSNNTYVNQLLTYDLKTKRWTKLHTTGDSIAPRHLAGVALNDAKDLIYLVGGFGSDSGNPILNPHYYYELNTLSLPDGSFEKKTHYSSAIHNFSFANSLVFDPREHAVYGLCFSSHKFNGELQLIKSTLNHTEWIEYGDKIPFLFQKNQSYADLFYSEKIQKLFAVTLFKDESNQCNIEIFSINFPPNKSVQLTENEHDKRKAWYWIILILLFDVVLFLGFIIRKKISEKRGRIRMARDAEKRRNIEMSRQSLAENNKPRSSIFLLGGFQAFDKKGEDITKLFTPLVKELFLIILLYPFKNGKGITSNRLTEMLWFDKPSAKAVNNRAVNMGKLKKILGLVGTCDFTNSNGYWTFVYNEHIPDMYIDVLELQKIIQKENISKEDVERLITIAQKGPVLTFQNYEWLDEIKERISSQFIDLLLGYLDHENIAEDTDLIIKIADCILIFDSINEEAIELKCKALVRVGKHGLAQKAFQKFTAEYELLYAIPYEKTLNEILM